MDRTERQLLIRRGLIAVAVVVVVGVFAGSWYFSNVLRGDLLMPTPFTPDPTATVAAVGTGRIVLEPGPDAERDGVFGLVGPNGYAQVSNVLAANETGVERGFRLYDGVIEAGDEVAFDQYAYAGDPQLAHGIDYREIRFSGDLGQHPAWVVDGDRDTWVLVVHGKGLEERRQALRMIPRLHQEGYPVFVITYRNDTLAPNSEDGRYGWGFDEWRDIESAMFFAEANGAEDFVLYGFSMGGAISATYLHEADDLGRVRGVVWDSPVLDLEAVVDSGADDRSVPGFLTWVAKGMSAIRFGIDWAALDQ
ncbi:MAG: alpha/beta hydrolase, partial [Acidimicrobiia bacterium]|nr:alpha/beta hydrolase [Acidimicrobiia bacterium]